MRFNKNVVAGTSRSGRARDFAPAFRDGTDGSNLCHGAWTDYRVRQPSGAFGAKGTLLENVGEAEAGICVKRGQTPKSIKKANSASKIAEDLLMSVEEVEEILGKTTGSQQ